MVAAASSRNVSHIQQGLWRSSDIPFLEVRTTLNSASAYAPHFHQCVSIGLVLAGQTQLSCMEESHCVSEGDVVLLEPEQVHSCNPIEGQPRSYHMLYLETDWCHKVIGNHDPLKEKICFSQRVLTKPQIYHEIVGEISWHQSGKKKDQKNRLEEVLQNLLKEYSSYEMVQESGDKKPALQAPQNFSSEHKPLSVRYMAHQAGYGRENFIRSFHRETGLPPGQYQQCQRLERARVLLKNGVSIAETAQETGYADQSHFHRMFVKYFSLTPRQYQMQKE